MRVLIFALLCCLFINYGMAQNGGQYPENNTVKLEYLGGGKIKVTNKQSFTCDFRVNDSKTESEITIAGNSTYMYQLPPDLLTNIRFKAKCITNNGLTDLGWTELFLAALPLKFVSLNTERISGTEFWVNFEIADATNVKQFNIKASLDGKIYKVITILWPDPIQPNRKYSVKVNLSNIKN
jgi:hypothetical protein